MNPPSKISDTDVADNVADNDDERVMSLLELALVQPQEKRNSYLRSACSGDEELFARVHSYVLAEERMSGFLLEPLFNPASLESPFAPGEVLEQRFRIVSEIARGGMGIVYEAFDQKLERRIAIKSAQAGFRKRLPPEVRNASEISHVNVCKIFEIHTAATDRGEVDFITMEFVDGETLTARLARGPLPPEEARALGYQLCSGLAEAHRNEVIHGDLKSSNIILGKMPDGSPRAVITDFGLARRPASAQRAAQSGLLGGTPDYMAPELWKGERASVSSDIYALGVILYELASGRRPFASEAGWEQRLTQKPAPVNSRGGSHWDRLLRRCLDPDPSRRFSSAGEMAQWLQPGAAGARTRRWLFAAAAAALAVTGGAVAYRNTLAPVDNFRLAVLPFETDAATAAISNGLLHDTGDRLSRVQPGRASLTMIPFRDTFSNRVNRPEDVASKLGGTHALSGSLRQENGFIVVRAHVTDARVNVKLPEWFAKYSPEELRNLPVAMAGMVTQTMGLKPLATSDTVNSAAYPPWSQGVALARSDSKDIDQALELLARAVILDPDSPLTHARLAEAQLSKYKTTSDDQWWNRANDSLQKAQLRNPDDPAVLFTSGVLNESANRFPEAEADLKRAIAIDKNNGDFQRELGIVYRNSGRPAEAVAALLKAISLQPNYYKNYEELGEYYSQRYEYEEAVRQFQTMVEAAPNLSLAHYELSRPYLSMGRYSDSESELRKAMALQETSNVLHGLAASLLFQDRASQALPYFQQALKLGPPTNNLFLLYLNWGSAYRRTGQPLKAQAAYKKALDLATRELERRSFNDAYIWACRAYLHARLRQRSMAEEDARVAASKSMGNMSVIWMLVQTYEVLDQRPRAIEALQDAPKWLVERVNHLSDLAGLRQDSRYINMTSSR